MLRTLCALLDELRPESARCPRASLITYVQDFPCHDQHYAIDASKIQPELGWAPEETFETGIRKTVEWYLENTDWVAHVKSGSYQQWIDQNYADRSSKA